MIGQLIILSEKTSEVLYKRLYRHKHEQKCSKTEVETLHGAEMLQTAKTPMRKHEAEPDHKCNAMYL